ncbi:MAG: TRAP transporter substrate-binding protein DctP [Desulfobacteraceae bacterium]|nr:TRAP transporter substrate-binding protein DctP [Desulfobacteraceae bacterium]
MKNHYDSASVKTGRRRVVPPAVTGLVLLLLLALVPAVQAAFPEFEIKLATLAPENSSLMKIFNEMNADLLKETGGKVGFKMFAGFVLGDEEDVLRKLRVGMVHAAAFTSTALTDINMDLRTLQVPFLFRNYKEVDYVMSKMDADLKRGFRERGFEVLGWPELGFIYFMSTTPVSSLQDLKGKKVWAKANAPMSQALIQKAGVSTVAINAPDVLVALQTNLVDVVYNSPYYALVTQWYTHVKYFTNAPLSYIGGALVVDRKVFDRIPAPLQETVRKVCARHVQRLIEKTRQDNAESLDAILKRGVKEIRPDDAQMATFKDLSEQAMADLIPKFLPAETMKKVKGWIEEFRAKPAG